MPTPRLAPSARLTMAKKKKSKDARHYCSLDNEYPLPAKWWADVSPIDERAWEDVLCDVSRWIQGFFGSAKKAKRLFYVDDIFRILAENEQLKRENKKLRKRMRKVTK